MTPNRQGIEFGCACLAGVLYWVVLWLTSANVPPVYPSAIMFLWLTVGSPTLEELAFRGFLQGELSRFFVRTLGSQKYQISFSNIVTSLVFCLLHVALYQTIWSALVFFPSLIFGYFKDRSQSVKPSTALHIFYNFGYFGLFGI